MAKTPEKDEPTKRWPDEPAKAPAPKQPAAKNEATATEAPPSDPLEPYPTGNPYYPPTEGVPHNSPPPEADEPPASRAHAQEKKP